MWTVYELRSGSKVEYVGQTKNLLKYRLVDHAQKRRGKFYGRTDLTIHALSKWPTRKEALLEEGRVKLSHGMPWHEWNRCKTTTFDIAEEIRSKYIPHKYTAQILAKEYNLTVNVIYGILNNKTYTECKQKVLDLQ